MILDKLSAIVNIRVPMVDVHFRPMDSWVNTGTSVFLKHSAREYTGGDIRKVALQDRNWWKYWASWTQQWIDLSVPMADVHLWVPYGLMSLHRSIGVTES